MSELCVRTPYSITRNREIPTMPWHQSSFCQGNPSFTPRSGNQILYCVIGAVYLKTISRQLKQVYSVETSISFFFPGGRGVSKKEQDSGNNNQYRVSIYFALQATQRHRRDSQHFAALAAAAEPGRNLCGRVESEA